MDKLGVGNLRDLSDTGRRETAHVDPHTQAVTICVRTNAHSEAFTQDTEEKKTGVPNLTALPGL